MAPIGPRLRRGALLVLVGLVLPGVVADRALGWLEVDWKLVESTLYYNEADPPLFQVSEDVFLHYEMSPGAEYSGQGPYGPYTAGVDRWGARTPEHPWDKPAGTLRVLYFGASTVFGANVSDAQTLPARLEERLRNALGQEVEVWNFGNSGHGASQIARLARRELARIPEPDLALVTLSGHTRRPFLPPWPVRPMQGGDATLEVVGPVDNRALFHQDPSLWTENFPQAPLAPLLGSRLGGALHGFGLRHLPSYRYLAALTVDWETERPPSDGLWSLGIGELQALEADARRLGVPLAWVNPPQLQGAPFDGATSPVLELMRDGRDPHYYDVHPPPEYLDAWAVELLPMLVEAGLVPAPVEPESE